MKMNSNSILANNFQSYACHLSEPEEATVCQFPLAVKWEKTSPRRGADGWKIGLGSFLLIAFARGQIYRLNIHR